MTDFIDGYSVTKVTGSVHIQSSIDQVSIGLSVVDGLGYFPQELTDALAAGQAAIKSALEATWPGNTAYVQLSAEGTKSL